MRISSKRVRTVNFPLGNLLQLLFLALFALSTVPAVDSGNILALLPHHGYSHFKVFYPLLRALAEHGHNLTVITHIKAPDPHPNYEELLLSGKETIAVVTFDLIVPKRSLPILLGEYLALHREGQEACNIFYNSGHVETVLERHKRTPYDLVITEYFNTDCQLGIPYILDVPVVGMSSCALMPYYYERIALPEFPSYVQSEFIGFPEELNWQERLINFIQIKLIKSLYRYYTNYLDRQVINKYLKVDFDVDAFTRRSTALILVNQHYTLSGNQPKTEQLIQMGGIHIEENATTKEMPQNILDFLAKEPVEQDVLFISWGSMMRGSSVPADKLKAMLSVLKRLPYKIIWKWESDQKPTESKKFLFLKWAPQLSLLCHPKVKLFWGHGGLLGTTEAVHCGKPLIVTPMYGDQFLNAYAVSNRHAGIVIFFEDINEHHLATAFKQIMDKSYAENARALSHMFRHRERAPLQSALWWVEHLLQEHGKVAHQLLQTKAVNLNWMVYHSLDSVALLLLCTVCLILFVWGVVKILRRLCASGKAKTD